MISAFVSVFQAKKMSDTILRCWHIDQLGLRAKDIACSFATGVLPYTRNEQRNSFHFV